MQLPTRHQVNWPKTRRAENKVRATWLQRGATVLFVVPDLSSERCSTLAESVPSDCHVAFVKHPLRKSESLDVLTDFFVRCRLLRRKTEGVNPNKKTGLLVFADGCAESDVWSPQASMGLNRIAQSVGAQVSTVHPRPPKRRPEKTGSTKPDVQETGPFAAVRLEIDLKFSQ